MSQGIWFVPGVFHAVPVGQGPGAACATTKALAAWPDVGAGSAWLTGPPSLPREMCTGHGCRAGPTSKASRRPGLAQVLLPQGIRHFLRQLRVLQTGCRFAGLRSRYDLCIAGLVP
jgi:hypothetical protein